MFAKQHLNEIGLLTLNEMKEIFPKSKIYHERFFGMSKSFTAYDIQT